MDNKELFEKFKLNVAISNFQKEEMKIPKRNVLKMVASFIFVIGITSGLVYATGTVVYEKIWKEPKAYKIIRELTEEEKSKCISEEEAEKIATSYLEKAGFEYQEIDSFALQKNYYEDKNMWRMFSKNVTIEINAEIGKLDYMQIPSWNYKIPYNYGITKEEARKTAFELFEKYNEDKDGEYELVKLGGNMETDEESYIWYSTFCKKYDNLFNENEIVDIGWVPTINGLYSLSFGRDVYEENEEKITKEQAIQIATEKDKKIEKEREIVGTLAELRIRKMNEAVYLRENFKEEYENNRLNYEVTDDGEIKLKDDAKKYKTEERVRKVWCVVIQYNFDEFASSEFTYFIDCTTGEIIGGARSNNLIQDENLYKK
jgi:hypothetical protein